VAQTPMTSDGHRHDWKCRAEYFGGDVKEFILPSPGLVFKLSAEEALEGAKNLRPQPFRGIYVYY